MEKPDLFKAKLNSLGQKIHFGNNDNAYNVSHFIPLARDAFCLVFLLLKLHFSPFFFSL